MVDIIFDTGVIGGEAVISAVITYNSEFAIFKNGQVDYVTGDSALITYDYSAPSILKGELALKNVSYADRTVLETWIREEAEFMLNSFSITCNPSTLIDLGLGRGTPLTGVKFNKKDTEGVFKYNPPGIFDIRFPYFMVRSA